MKFVHIADMHFDSSLSSLSEIEGLTEKIRLEQRKIFRKIINYIKENKIELLFIAGDLYEQKYIRETTIEYINNLFKEIPETKIFIAPGNHDPNIKNSYYQKFNWNENVKIFNSKIEKIKLNNINIYGYGFEDYYCKNSGIEEINLDEKNKINILITHASLDASKTEDMQYNPISKNKLEKIGFNYVALGHIHKNNYEKNNKIIYPGSTIGLGFDELGEHGMVVGEIFENKIETEFIPLNNIEFCERELDITEINSEEELIEKIKELNLIENNLYKIILIGKRNFIIDTQKIIKLINKKNILKIKDFTKIKYNLEEISKQQSLKGIFVKKCLEEMQNTENKEIIENAIEYGLEALEG